MTALPGCFREHPALRAWGRLSAGTVEPRSIELLQRKTKSNVYRLAAADVGGADVIGKRAPEAVVRHEALIYGEILPHLAMPALHCIGTVTDGEQSWIFLEDAGGDEYREEDDSHRTLAGRWIGELHAGAQNVAVARQLPSRASEYYRMHLESARNNVMCNMDNAAATADDRIVLATIIVHFETCASAWQEVEDVCGRMPETLVHNDFRVRNVRVRSKDASAALMCFDWELSGWGIAGADLAQFTGGAVSPDLHAYWMAVREMWPHLTFTDIREFSRAGSMLRLLASIRWASAKLADKWLERTMMLMRIYEPKLAVSARVGEWRD